jgi:hypothetical protein
MSVVSIHRDGAVFLDAQRGRLFTTNHIGSLIWVSLQQGTNASVIAKQLSDRFGISIERATADVERFVNDLASLHLQGVN